MADAKGTILEVVAKPAPLEPRRFSLVSKRSPLKGTVYLLLDHSSSMADGQKLIQVKRGALRFFAEAYRRQYAIGMIGFAQTARCFLGATRNFYRFQKGLEHLQPGGSTAMSAAMRLGSKRLRWRRGYRALLLITDGQPMYREHTLELARLIRAQGIELIALGTDGADQDFLRALNPQAELVGVRDLANQLSQLARSLPEA
ncbi:MAG: VWA domain-containing protein [Trueperaceae bacterium]|nr:VWA domain-containing protein [Trueperaceae bacterium]